MAFPIDHYKPVDKLEATMIETLNRYIGMDFVYMKNKFSGIMLTLQILLIFCILVSIFSRQALAGEASSKEMQDYLTALESKCAAYGWNDIDLTDIPWESHRVTRQKRPLMFATFGSGSNCTLFLGGVHGDELPSIYLLLKLADTIRKNPELFKDECIIIAPLINPDGFFANPPKRVNANGVDTNRNFPTKEWKSKALSVWAKTTKKNKRYYPGSQAGSELETQFQIALIKRFNPQKILSIHSPLNFYDFDGQSAQLDNFENWLDEISKETNHPFKKYGIFPGSLGNYAGNERDILTLTLELPSSDADKGKEYFDKFYSALFKFTSFSLALK
jgi:murein peptide amidase A